MKTLDEIACEKYGVKYCALCKDRQDIVYELYKLQEVK